MKTSGKILSVAALLFCMVFGCSFGAYAAFSEQEIEVFAYSDEESIYSSTNYTWNVDSHGELAYRFTTDYNGNYGMTIAGKTSNGYWVTPVWGGLDEESIFEFYAFTEIEEELNDISWLFDREVSATASEDGRYFIIRCKYTNTHTDPLTIVPQVFCDTCIDGDDATRNYSNENHTICTLKGTKFREEYDESVQTSFIIFGETGGFRVKGVENWEYADSHYHFYEDYTEVEEAFDSAFVGRWNAITVQPGESATVFFKAAVAKAGEESTIAPELRVLALPSDAQEENDDYDPEPENTGSWDGAVDDGQWNCGPGYIWTYRTNGGFRGTWGYLENPYAGEGQHTNDWFYFGDDGAMVTGWFKLGDFWYYFNEDKDGTYGAMQTGWVQYGEDWYYLNESQDDSNGMMLVNTTTPDGHVVDENGKRIR